jgi:hypothetical protein
MDNDWQTELKLELNNVLWMKAPGATPLKVLEDAACAALTIVNKWNVENDKSIDHDSEFTPMIQNITFPTEPTSVGNPEENEYTDREWAEIKRWEQNDVDVAEPMVDMDEAINQALISVSGGLSYFTVEAKHAQLKEIEKILTEVSHVFQGQKAIAPPIPDLNNALIKAERALSDIAEGELEWAINRCIKTLKDIRPVMKDHNIRTSQCTPTNPQTKEVET